MKIKITEKVECYYCYNTIIITDKKLVEYHQEEYGQDHVHLICRECEYQAEQDSSYGIAISFDSV